MGRGRKPKPTALKVLAGESADRINDREPSIPPGDHEAPAWLGGTARALWGELEPVLSEAGVVSAADRLGLALLCDAYERSRDKDESANQRRHARNELIRLMIEFGLTPSSRSKVKAIEKAKDDLAEFLGKRKA